MKDFSNTNSFNQHFINVTIIHDNRLLMLAILNKAGCSSVYILMIFSSLKVAKQLKTLFSSPNQ